MLISNLLKLFKRGHTKEKLSGQDKLQISNSNELEICNSNELQICKEDNKFKVTDKLSGHWFKLDFANGVYDEHENRIEKWDFVKQYPTVIPTLIDLGYLEKWENGFKIRIEYYDPTTMFVHGNMEDGVDPRLKYVTYYYDMPMIHIIIKYSANSVMYGKYGKDHRLDGPAGTWEDGNRLWAINGKNICYDVEEWPGGK